MTNFRVNTQNNVNAFVDVTRSELFVVKSCGTINKIENSSFEAPEYYEDGTLRQYNWSYSPDSTPHRAYPVTYNHAFSGSFAWKARMTTTSQYITYGTTRGIQRTSQSDHHDILSFYCYCAEDGPTYSVKDTNQLYVPLIVSRDIDFVLSVYGMTDQIYSNATKSPTPLYTKTFTLKSIPKDQPGDVTNGISGTRSPFFYPWTRVELSIPKFSTGDTYPYLYFTIGRVTSNDNSLVAADGTITTSTGSKIVNGTLTEFTPRDIGFKIFTTSGVEIGTINSYTDTHKINLVNNATTNLTNQSFKFQYPTNDTYFVIDGVQCEDQPLYRKATMYFDGSYEGFNTVRYPEDFQFTGDPYKSMSIRSPFTRVSGEIIDMNDYCNFYTKSIDGLATPNTETIMYSKTLRDGQHFVEQIIQNGKVTVSGRIVADTHASYVDSFKKFQELLGKKPFNDPEPLRLFLRLQFTTGKTLLPVYFDAVYESGLEMDTKNVFQEDINITFQMISTHLQYQNDSATNMFNDSPLHDQFNTMNTNAIRDIAGFVFYNNVTNKWESPGGIGFFKVTDTTYTSLQPFDSGLINQKYDTKTHYTVGDVYTVKEDKDGIIWIGGRFDMIEYDAYYIRSSDNVRVDVRLQVRCNNIVGIRNRQMVTSAFVYPELEDFGGKYITNGQTLTLVEAISEWQIIALVDAPTRYSHSNELSPTAFVGIPGETSTVYSIEFTPNGDIFIGGTFDLTYGGRKMLNFCSFRAMNTDAQNVSIYKPDLMNQTLYNFVNTNYNQSQLRSTTQGNGIYRTNWVNSAIPYLKYGTFNDEGGVGSAGHSCRSIVYDYANECLYLGGDFIVVREPDRPSVAITAYRIARYDPVKQSFTGFLGIGGIAPKTTSYSANVIVMTLALQYVAGGTRLLMGGKWTPTPTSAIGAGYDATGKYAYTMSFAVATISFNSPVSDWAYESTGGGGNPSAPPTIYDIIVTHDQRVYVAGDFTELNYAIGITKIAGMAEYRYGRFIDVTRGLEANFYPDGSTSFPSVRSLAEDQNNNLYLVGQFSNIQNRLNVDGIARWDGKNYAGTGIYFQPAISKTLQKVYIDSSNNVLLFTGPNANATTVLRTIFTDPSVLTNYNVNVLWENFPYSDLKAKFFADGLDFEFLNITVDSTTGILSYSYGIINCAVRVGPALNSSDPYHADEETTFIGGKFTHLRVGDSYFRCNNLVALRYDIDQQPFPYKVLVFSNVLSVFEKNNQVAAINSSLVYDDMIGFTSTGSIIGVNANSNVTNGQVYSIDVTTIIHDTKKVPDRLFVGGRFDFTAVSMNGVTSAYDSYRIKNLFVIEIERNAAGHDLEFNIPRNNEKNISVPYVNYANYVFVGRVGALGQNDAVYKVKRSHDFSSTRTNPFLLFVGGDFVQSVGIQSNGLLQTAAMPTCRLAVLPYENYSVGTTTSQYQLCHITLSKSTSTAIGVNTGTSTYNANIYVKGLAYTNWYVVTADQDTRLIIGGRFSAYGSRSRNALGTYRVMNNTTLSISDDDLAVTLSANLTPAAPIVNDLDVNYNEYVFIAGDFQAVIGAGTTKNIALLLGDKNTSAISLEGITDYFTGPVNMEYIYDCVNGVDHATTRVQRQQLSGTVTWSGSSNGTVSNLFPDATILLYNGANAFVPVNYAYAAPNIAQSVISTSGKTVSQPSRKLMQAPTTNIGANIEIETAISPYSVSIPYQNANNTLYNAAVLQEFNCYNTGTTSVYPTITMFCPYKPTTNTVPYYHVINNVTTEQSIYFALTMSANEVIRIRTERERISVVSNQRGDITNAIINSRNVSLNNSNDSQIFRLIPGKNVITYGPSFPMQRCFYEVGISSITYNYNMNIVVPPIILSLSWSIGFNSIYDANATEINPLLLL